MLHYRMSAKIIWTKHARQRLSDRRMQTSMIEQAINSPDYVKRGKTPGSTEYIKRNGSQTITAITKPNDTGELVVISTWVDPPYAGTKDARSKDLYLKEKKAGFWGKIFWGMVRQIVGH